MIFNVKAWIGLASAACIASAGGTALGRDGVYLRAGGGVNFANDLERRVAPSPPPPGLGTCAAIGCNPDRIIIETDTGLGFASALGVAWTKRIRSEIEYGFRRSAVDKVRLFEAGYEAPPPTPDSERVVAHSVMANVYYDIANSSPLTPFVGAGAGFAFVDTERLGHDAAFAYQARAGVSAALGGGFSADLEYVYIRTRDLDFLPASSSRLGDGEPYAASSAMVSFRKAF